MSTLITGSKASTSSNDSPGTVKNFGNKDYIAPSVLAVFAFLLACFCATATLDNDHTVLLTAASRIAEGEIMYRDFGLPYALIPSYILALFVMLSPTAGWGFVLASGFLNAAACLLMYRIIYRHTESRGSAIISGVVTAFCFLPVFGGFYMDHLAYFFILAGFVLYFQGTTISSAIIAGLCMALALYSKPSVAAAGFLATGVAVVLFQKEHIFRDKRIICAGIGFLAVNALVLIYLYIIGGIKLFYFFSWELATDYAQYRSFSRLIYGTFFPFRIHPISMIQELGWGRISFYPFVLLMYYSYYKIFSLLKNGNQKTGVLLLFLVCSTLWCAAISGGIHYFKVLFGTGGILALCLPYRQKALTQLVVVAACLLVSVYIVRFRALWQPYQDYYLQTDLAPIRMHQLYDKQSSDKYPAANIEIISYLKDKEGKLAVLGNTPHLIPLAAGKAPVAWTGDYLHAFGLETDHPYYQKSQDLLYTSLNNRKPRFILAVTSNNEFFRFMDPEYMQEIKVLLKDNYRVVLDKGWVVLLEKI